MNFPRYPNRPQPGGNNFAHHLHEFMDSLGRIAQIMYTSIPIIEFTKLATRYLWKFCEHLGTHILCLAGIITVKQRPEAVLEALWNKQPVWRSLPRYSLLLAIAVVVFCLLLSKPDLEEEWNKAPEVQQEESRGPEVRSVEDKPYEETYEEYNPYGMY
jgi:hypothetical protein